MWLETETETWLKARYEYFSRCEQLVRVGRVLKLSSPFNRNKKQKKKEKQTRKKEQKGQLQTATKPNPPQQPTKVASPNERVQQQQQQVLNKPQKK